MSFDSEYSSSVEDSDDSYCPSYEEPKRYSRVICKKRKREIVEVTFEKKVETLDELIGIAKRYKVGVSYRCNINLVVLNKILPELIELNAMVGLKELKASCVKHILYLLLTSGEKRDMRHLILFGPPGTGKTTVAKLLGRIYAGIGLLDKDKFKIATRADLVAKYEGQTEHKTQNFLQSCLGGVVFIDEAYSLGTKSSDGSSYIRIVVDALNEFLSNNSDKLICMLAGYKKDIYERVLALNPGLERRFTFRYEIMPYTSVELADIMKSMIKMDRWKLDKNINLLPYLDAKYYTGNAGDVKTFLEKCKEVHYQRALTIDSKFWKILSEKDVKDGYKSYCNDKQLKDIVPVYSSMYI